MYPECGVCFSSLDPVTAIPTRLACNHVYCIACTTKFADNCDPCPLRCLDNATIRGRDARELSLSLAPCTQESDFKAVYDATSATFHQFEELQATSSSNNTLVDTFHQRTCIQLETLSRYHTGIVVALSDRGTALDSLKNSQQNLISEIHTLRALDARLESLRQNIRKSQLRLSQMEPTDSKVIGQKRRREDDASDDAPVLRKRVRRV